MTITIEEAERIVDTTNGIVSAWLNTSTVVLQGEFTADELEAITVVMRHAQQKKENKGE